MLFYLLPYFTLLLIDSEEEVEEVVEEEGVMPTTIDGEVQFDEGSEGAEQTSGEAEGCFVPFEKILMLFRLRWFCKAGNNFAPII